MRKASALITWILFCALLFLGGALVYRYDIIDRAQFYIAYYFPQFSSHKCAFPRTYRIGSIDSRFEISRQGFKEAIQEAENIWESALGKDLFTESVSSTMPIDLVYDDRQMLTQKMNELSSSITTDKEKYESLKQTLESTRAQITADRKAYEAEAASYTELKNTYDQRAEELSQESTQLQNEITAWNAKGSIPKDIRQELMTRKDELSQEYKKLENERTTLLGRYDALEKQRIALNLLVAQENTLVDILNTYAQRVNSRVEGFNSIPQGEFESGHYVRTSTEENIAIYQYANHSELVKILAHELGHSLGLDHEEGDPTAIMYPLMKDQKAKLTDADIALFRSYCKQ